MENIKKRVEELTKILNDANYNYYVLDNPTITDQEYDKYIRELEGIEEEYPEFAGDVSPTKRVGGEVISKFEKVIRDKNIIVLKMKVQEAGLLWGITDIEEVTKLAKYHRIDPKTLQGQYGKQIIK